MASELLKEVSDAEFQREVLDCEGLVMVDFWATWCAPCLAMMPAVEEMAKVWEGKVKFVKFNIENSTEVPQRYSITSIPRLLFFKKGSLVHTIMTPLAKAKLNDAIAKVVG